MRSEVLNDNQIEQAEQAYNAKFVADLPIKDKVGQWVNIPVAIFYVEKPEPPHTNNYFGLLWEDEQLMICDGTSATIGTITGVEAYNGEIIYSPYRHAMTKSKDGSVYIDGGRDYTKTNCLSRLRVGTVEKDKLVWRIPKNET
jgi:hypothetical protein